jgi:hypothetical protein
MRVCYVPYSICICYRLLLYCMWCTYKHPRHFELHFQTCARVLCQTLTHGYAYTHVYDRCESVRKIIERVFGMLKKRFRILRLPMLVKDMAEVEDIVKVCCVLHNMCLQVHKYTYTYTYIHV